MSKWATLVAVAALLLSAACDSTQPLNADGGTATLTITTSQAGGLDVFDIWDIYQDTDGDGVADLNLNVPWCEQIVDTNGVPVRTGGRVPWKVTVRVKVIRAGETTPETVFADSPNDLSFTPYDSNATPLQDRQFTAEFGPQFWGLNGRRVTSANPDFLTTCLHFADLEPERLLGGSQPFTVDLNKGDTIVVEARTDLLVLPTLDIAPIDHFPGGIKAGPISLVNWHDPDLTGALAIDGRPVTPNGKSAGGFQEDSGGWISFSYTLR